VDFSLPLAGITTFPLPRLAPMELSCSRKGAGSFAVVVSDFQMPGMNGAEFLKEIRAMDAEVVTMLLTGAAYF